MSTEKLRKIIEERLDDDCENVRLEEWDFNFNASGDEFFSFRSSEAFHTFPIKIVIVRSSHRKRGLNVVNIL